MTTKTITLIAKINNKNKCATNNSKNNNDDAKNNKKLKK